MQCQLHFLHTANELSVSFHFYHYRSTNANIICQFLLCLLSFFTKDFNSMSKILITHDITSLLYYFLIHTSDKCPNSVLMTILLFVFYIISLIHFSPYNKSITSIQKIYCPHCCHNPVACNNPHCNRYNINNNP